MANEIKSGTAPTLGQSNLAVTPGATRAGRFLRRLVEAVTQRFRTSQAAMDIEALDPLFGLTAQEAQQIFNYARSGNFARLQFIYNEIERTDPTLLVCVTRRKSALSELDWKVVRSDERLHSAGVTPEMEQAQIEFLETFMAKIDNLPEAIEHLSLAAFRGFSHVFPIWANAERTQVRRFQLPNSWNFCYDKQAQAWLWNAQASSFLNPKKGAEGLVEVPADARVTITDEQAIDWPALMIFLRKSMGERNWGRFLEQFGIPPVILTMPEVTTEDEEQSYLAGAQAIFDGRSGVVPYGTNVSWATEARGTDPYQVFLDYQAKQIVLMATGGILTSLAESGSGTLGGNAHQDTWKQIAKRYVRIISNAINRQLCVPVMRRVFPGQPILAEFKLETEADLTASEVLDLAEKAKAAGFTMDETELSEQTGFTIKRDPAMSAGGMGGGFPGGPGGGGGFAPETDGFGQTSAPVGDPLAGDAANDPSVGPQDAAGEGLGGTETGEETANGATAQEGVVTNAGSTTPTERSAAEKLAAALQRDYADVAARIQAILDLPEEERPAAAEKLSQELDGLVPDDPQMAAVIASEMTQAFARQEAAQQAVTNSVENTMSKEEAARHAAMVRWGKEQANGDVGTTRGTNDGKIVFKGPEAIATKKTANEQCRRLGYSGVDDMMQQSVSVPAEKVDEILGGKVTYCRPHEAIAAMRSGKKIQPKDSGEEPVVLSEFAIRHYVCGERRKGNEPKIENLCGFPQAVRAITQGDSVRHTLGGAGVIKGDDGKWPRGTQTEYRKLLSRKERVVASAYTDSGVLSGWRFVPA